MYTRRIICLANSYKHGGTCVAGRAYQDGSVEEWVRPVSAREGRELSQTECSYGLLRGSVAVGDIADVQLARPARQGHQVENHEIAGADVWQKTGCATWTLLYACQDEDCPDFWINRGSSSRGLADRVPVYMASDFNASLQMIYLPRMEFLVGTGFNGGKEVRACFSHLGQEYRLKVTDPWVCKGMKAKPVGHYPVGMALLCISISEPFDGHLYRLVATVITPRGCESFRS